MINVSLWGESGRMGQEVKKISAQFPKIRIVSPSENPDGFIDFSSPEGLLTLLKKLDMGKSSAWVVSGSTGLGDDQFRQLDAYAKKRPVLWAANFSFGVLALNHILAFAKNLPELSGYLPRIRETHHLHKKDSPSGTALALKKILPSDTPIESLREGEVVGTHEIWFDSGLDQVGIVHEAKDRSIFAQGAVRSAILLTKLLQKNPKITAKGRLELSDLF